MHPPPANRSPFKDLASFMHRVYVMYVLFLFQARYLRRTFLRLTAAEVASTAISTCAYRYASFVTDLNILSDFIQTRFLLNQRQASLQLSKTSYDHFGFSITATLMYHCPISFCHIQLLLTPSG